MSMAGIAVLADEIRSDAVLLCSGPRLPQPQMVDLAVGLGCLEPTLAEASFEAGGLELLLKEIDLAAQRLALFIHGSVPVDFCHETPVVNGEFVKLATECSERGPAPTESSNKPGR